MSTRATVWIKNENTGDEKFLYHHCDGYALDEDLDEVLSGIPAYEWEVEDIARAIINFDDAYGTHDVDSVGWDSEYVYVISIKDRTLKKYECGISSSIHYDCKEEKTQQKYLIREIEYGPKCKAVSEDTETDVKRTAEKIKDLAENMKRLMDWCGGTMGLGHEEIMEAATALLKMYINEQWR